MSAAFPPAPPGITKSSAAREGLVQPLQLVGARCGLRHSVALSGSNLGSMSRTKHRVFGTLSEISLVYAGFDIRNVDEQIAPVGVYRVARPTVASGGSGHVVGDIVGLGAGVTVATARVVAVNAGAITKLKLLNPGVYDAVLADATAQSSTTGAGTGATFNYEWDEGAYFVNAAIEPDFTQTQVTSGIYNARWARKGVLKADANSATDLVPALGEILVSDPIPLSVTGAANIGLRQYVRGKTLSVGLPTNAAEEYGNTGTPGNVSLTGATLTAQPQTPVYQPALILGRPTKRITSFVLMSHSIGQAVYNSGNLTGDRGDADGNIGWFERAVGGLFPFANLCRAGDKYSNWFKSPAGGSLNGRNLRYELLKLARPTDIVVDCSVNDFGSSATFATVQTYEAQICAELRSLVKPDRIWLVTTTPQTTSDNNWATSDGAAHQTYVAAARNTAMQARNAALRAGTYTAGHDYYLDWGTFVETTLTSGYWPGGVTGDGTHFIESVTANAAALMRAQIIGRVPAN